MGGSPLQLPPELKTFPTNKSKSPKIRVEYCGAWGYIGQAKLVEEALKICYPSAVVELISPGHTSNIVVIVDGTEVWNKKKGDGVVTDKSIMSVMQKVKAKV